MKGSVRPVRSGNADGDILPFIIFCKDTASFSIIQIFQQLFILSVQKKVRFYVCNINFI